MNEKMEAATEAQQIGRATGRHGCHRARENARTGKRDRSPMKIKLPTFGRRRALSYWFVPALMAIGALPPRN